MLRKFLSILFIFSIGYQYSAQACTIIIVGKKASADGSNIISHTDTGPDSRIFVVPAQTFEPGEMAAVYWGIQDADRELDDDGIILGYIPQVEKTYKYFQSAYSHLNEHQLGIGESTTGQRDELVCTRENGKQIMTIEQAQIFALQRYKNAREAVQFIGDLMIKYGFLPSSGDGSETLVIADTEEIWVFEVFGVGEGEPLWPKVLADFEKGKMEKFYVQKKHGDYDLNEAPVPRFDLLDPDKYNRLTVQTSRGCPWKCEFCASSILLSNRYKLKPVVKVIEEIQAIKNIWDRPFIEFADDNSFVNHSHSKELCRALIKEQIAWFTETDISVAQDMELLGLLRDSGCKQILIGLESPSKACLDGIELNANWKLKQRDFYLESIAKIQSFGITVNGCFVFGLDGDTSNSFEEVHSFINESGLYEVQITYLTPFPGTPLYQRLKKEKRLLKDKAWELTTLFDPNFIPKNMTVKELNTGFIKLGSNIYSSRETNARRNKFLRRLLISPNITYRRKLHYLLKVIKKWFKK